MVILRKLGLPRVPFVRRGSTARRLVLAFAIRARPISRPTPVQKLLTNVSAKSQLLVKPELLITKLGALAVNVKQVSSPLQDAVLHGKYLLLSYNLILLAHSHQWLSLSLSLADFSSLIVSHQWFSLSLFSQRQYTHQTLRW